MVPTNATLNLSYQKGAGAGVPPDDALHALGLVVSNAQMLEFFATRLLGKLSGCDLTIAIISFWGLNAKAKRETIENLAYQLYKQGDQELMKISKAMATFKSVSEDRNRIVHALWSFEGGIWKRTVLPTSAEQIDTSIGGYPERRSRTQSLIDRLNYSTEDMMDVNDKMAALAIEIEAILTEPDHGQR